MWEDSSFSSIQSVMILVDFIPVASELFHHIWQHWPTACASSCLDICMHLVCLNPFHRILSIAFGLTDTEAFIANSLPVIAFIVVCFTCKSDIQLAVAEFLSVVYALVMVAMVIGIIISASEDGGSAPTSLSLIYTVFIFLLAGILHPQEANCLPMGVIYLLTIPSMYLLLVIYSVFNLNNVSWGTRYTHHKNILTKFSLLCDGVNEMLSHYLNLK